MAPTTTHVPFPTQDEVNEAISKDRGIIACSGEPCGVGKAMKFVFHNGDTSTVHLDRDRSPGPRKRSISPLSRHSIMAWISRGADRRPEFGSGPHARRAGEGRLSSLIPAYAHDQARSPVIRRAKAQTASKVARIRIAFSRAACVLIVVRHKSTRSVQGGRRQAEPLRRKGVRGAGDLCGEHGVMDTRTWGVYRNKSRARSASKTNSGNWRDFK